MKSLSDGDNVWAGAIFIVAAFLCLYNLGYAPLWHDEGVLAMTGKNIAATGGYNGWDGRNLFSGGIYAGAVNSDLKIVSYPPWQGLPSALGIALFGANEVGVRFFHAVLGLLSLGLFWYLLRLDFATRPRLRVLAFALFALSAQAILFFRQGRYAADSVFFALLLFYCYRCYMSPNGRWWHLTLATGAVVLGFFNHFAIGGAFALALGVWHLLYYARQTSKRQWAEMAVAAAVVAALCFWYLAAAGIIFSDEQLEFAGGEDAFHFSWSKRKALLIFYNFREMLQFGWLPLWVALWFGWFAFMMPTKKQKIKKKGKRGKQSAAAVATSEDAHIARWAVLLALFLFFSGLLALRAVAVHPLADSRYIVPALPFCALIVAAFVDWLWRREGGAWFAIPVLALALCSNALSFPYIYPNIFTQEKIRLTLPSLIGEISRPYDNYTREIVAFLDEHAKQDETIFAPNFVDFSVFQFYLGDKMIFCCALSEQMSLRKKERIRALKREGAPALLFEGDALPDWQVLQGTETADSELYDLVYTSKMHGYPTQRPELEFHAFRPLSAEGHFKIYRKK